MNHCDLVKRDLDEAMEEIKKGRNHASLPAVVMDYNPQKGVLMAAVRMEFLCDESKEVVKDFLAPYADTRAMAPCWALCSYVVFVHRSAREELENCRRAVLAKVCERGPKTYDLETPPYSADFFLGGHP